MTTEQLRQVYGTLIRTESFLQDAPDFGELEMLRCEIDEAKMYIQEELVWRKAVELQEDMGTGKIEDYLELARDELGVALSHD